MKVAHDNRRVIPAAVQITPQVSHQLQLGTRPFSPNCIGLKVLVKHLVRVQTRTVGRQEKHLHPARCRFQPVADRLAPVHRCPSTIRKTFRSVCLTNRRRNRTNTLAVKCLLNTMNARSPRLVIAERTFAPKRLPVPGRIGVCLSGIRPSRLMIRRAPSRPPIQLCLLYFRTRPDDWYS